MTTPVIVNQINVSNDMYGYHVSFKTFEECAWARKKIDTFAHILETHMGRFNLVLNAAEYKTFIDSLTDWEEAGYISVP